MLGILVADKPQGMTSHDVVAITRKKLKTKKIGHAGTLDPLATGVLILAIGHATRFLQYLDIEPKRYEGIAVFGVETDTQDAEGQVLKVSPVPQNLNSLIQTSLTDFIGEIQQIPPMYSAVKKHGQPLYKYAHKGKVVERESRRTTIFSFEVLRVDAPFMQFSVECAGGTYIRTLIHDLGQKLGCGAHLTQLRRTQVGNYQIEQVVSLNEVSEEKIIPLNKALSHLPVYLCNQIETKKLQQGQSIFTDKEFMAPHVVALDENRHVLAMLQAKSKELSPICVIPK